MWEAVVVATARTALAKSFRGSKSPTDRRLRWPIRAAKTPTCPSRVLSIGIPTACSFW